VDEIDLFLEEKGISIIPEEPRIYGENVSYEQVFLRKKSSKRAHAGLPA